MSSVGKYKVYMIDGHKSLMKAYLLSIIPELGWKRISEIVDKKPRILVPYYVGEEDVKIG